MPCKDDKPKDTEISLFKAGSDYSLSVIKNALDMRHIKGIGKSQKQGCETLCEIPTYPRLLTQVLRQCI